jgi:hypothetical protein
MAVEVRKGRFYLYDRRRVKGRVETHYCGPLDHDTAEMFQLIADRKKKDRENAHHLIRLTRREADEILATGEE